MFLLLRGRDPVGEDDQLILDRNEADTDSGRTILVLALVKQLGGVEVPDLELVFLFRGLVQRYVVALEHFKGVFDLTLHAFFSADRDHGNINSVVRTLDRKSTRLNS